MLFNVKYIAHFAFVLSLFEAAVYEDINIDRLILTGTKYNGNNVPLIHNREHLSPVDSRDYEG